ncbi:MAG: HAMP domain-containing sensor histidine kinase [Peptoniphilus harei]|uniref:sensor histidine kinase n=1 Tax=Peptoniphilus harei TaxID=54005 RepID=UPI002549FFC8|nr:HAMP domain-containing sensor histidine kinase [Peptoniphilus harei]MDK7755580.1 HAMP domain-containing sensor histidine kinase [Peptoniphilus harei]MDK7761069.1 HAMP domain-containing sensor histidine kinase [Peptoniphilus harei]MDK8270859.1 HAMP domain-containing sensor histidine kinase [Peptoniphilus harei]MDK8339437.1 HAMP domain-containing sensor histidine kinase [Peptoniphilus harei]
MIYLFYPVSLLALYYFLKKRQKKRIEELENLIDRLGEKNYSIPMVQDDFSILEDKIYKIFIELVEARELVEKNSKKQTQNLEDIAHQIKTPITSMFFDLETIDKTEDNKKEIEGLELQLERLNSLADILLKLSSLDANIDKMEKREVLISEIIDYVLDILRKSIDEKKVKIICDYEDYEIKVDYYWISEALINIIKNALSLDRLTKIKISTNKNPIYTEIIIEDDGGGIKEENLKKIFERFYKSPDSKGFGIGLAMAKSIVEANNGAISVKNGKDGAIFKIKFYNVT